MEILENNKLEVVKGYLAKAMDYPRYRALVSKLAMTGASTGPNQSELYVNYTKLGDKRMSRWEKTFQISEEVERKLKSYDRELVFLVLTESWCGDAAASLPVMNKIAEASPNISLKVILRDESLDLMDAFLTNGARSIPKLIVLDKAKNEIIGEWGPRPSIATLMVEDYKWEHGKLSDEFKQELQVWYNKNKGQNILEDIVELLALK
ncbi:thioredoxin family protein [Muricauda oceani]|uniref:Thioredoxin family protein n=1 Tax=Flagellimonas oceani TaxID=2698672 RepID=A0A6G7J5E8_9FLAO|nr:thioredoxin family protein [Allomuricauda oceani]MBW8242255.1 thioredoxin family protein [Allomuricauda oceani]QII46016.1 thioredoxin family protein [Allomuricauda oceani]